MTERELFTEALTRSDPNERAAFLVDACAGDDTLRRRVEALLARHAQVDSRLDRPADLLADLAAPNSALLTSDKTADAGGQLAGLLTPSERPGSLGRVGHYDVLEIRGQGGFGIVARAFDNSLQRVVAIKFLSPALAATSPPRQRFLREARAAARVTHDHVVRVHAVEEQPIPYLVMEYVEGRTLQDIHEGTGPLDPAEVTRIGRQIALGLAAAHEQGLIHRDVKPANVLIDAGAEGRARLTDFGLARAADDACLTQSGTVAGTPMYMAPEQVRGEVLDARADLFSLGSVLYTITAGRPPFRAANAFAVLKRVAEDRPRPLPEVMPGTPLGLVAVIDKLLAKQPDDRFATAREAADALAVCLANDMPPGAGPVPAPGSSSLRMAIPAAAMLGIAVICLLTIYAWPSPDKDQPSPAKNAPGPAARPSPSDDGRTVDAAWQREVAAMPARQQVDAVVARLELLNPKFKGTSVKHKIVDGNVEYFGVPEGSGLYNLSPIRALRGLRGLGLIGAQGVDIRPLQGMQLNDFEAIQCKIPDLSPLAGMPLRRCDVWQLDNHDLSPLRNMQLQYANVGSSQVKDISCCQGMPLLGLTVSHSHVEDLTPLKRLPLKTLYCEHTRVKDISPLTECPLEDLRLIGSPVEDYSTLRKLPLKTVHLDYDPVRHAELLRGIATLETINGRPARQFLNDPQNAPPSAGPEGK